MAKLWFIITVSVFHIYLHFILFGLVLLIIFITVFSGRELLKMWLEL